MSEKSRNRKRKKESRSEDEPKALGYNQDITFSMSRKLNMKDHGGLQFETADIFASRTFKDVNSVDAETARQVLYETVKKDLEDSIDIYLGKVRTEKITKKAEKQSEALGEDDYAGVDEITQKLMDAADEEEIIEIGEEIKNGDFNKKQLEALRKVYADCLKSLSKKR